VCSILLELIFLLDDVHVTFVYEAPDQIVKTVYYLGVGAAGGHAAKATTKATSKMAILQRGAAASVAGGTGVAIKIMHHMPVSPGTKAQADGATIKNTQALTVGLEKIPNMENPSKKNNYTKKFVEFFYSSRPKHFFLNVGNNALYVVSNFNDKLNDFPLNLLPEINQLVTAELMFLLIIFNIFIVKYISTKDYNKYIPNNKAGKILSKLLNRYLMIWSKSVTLLLIVSWSGIFICVIGCKIFLYYVLGQN
jgi:hypothetical protein